MLLENLIKKREDGSLYIDSLDLNKYLNEGHKKNTRHNDWIRSVLKNFEFEEGFDYITVVRNFTTAQGNNSKKKNHQLTLNMAKEVCMIDKRPRGREVRKYFIEIEQLYYKQIETNLKLGSMLLTHREKLQLTKELFYPILEKLGVLDVKKNIVHQKIIKSLFGKYENLNKLTKLTDEDIENYKRLAISMQNDTKYFEDKNQITVWDIIKEL